MLFCSRKSTCTPNANILFKQKILKLKDSSKPKQLHQKVVKNCLFLGTAQLSTLSEHLSKGDIIAAPPDISLRHYIRDMHLLPLETNGTDVDLS